MWRDALLVAGKDLRIELRSRITINQILPFAFIVLIVFAFALDTSPDTLKEVAPGLFWLAVLFSSILGVDRAVAIERNDSAGEGLLVYGVDPGGIFLGKAASVFVQLFLLEIVLILGMVVLYGPKIGGWLLIVLSAVFATLGISAAGVLYSQLASGSKAKQTLLPLLLVPVASPVLLAATKSWQDAFAGTSSLGDPWLRLLIVFAVVYLALGSVFYSSILEG
ncbi:MAG: hypothetical protein EPN30_11185 [Actinomycetota bacterium]|nr:MAG: hypothetical protein EPN30_11185 [Actinomycetota bacterium]